ncbi:MAG: nucleotidyltransferase domain-containing protein [Candidatus Micrarchaeota archaeon]
MFNILNMLEQYAIVKAIEKLTSLPNRSFSVREFAKFSKISPAMASKALEYMNKGGIATLKKVGKTYQYRANIASPLCRQWKILFNIEKIEKAGIVQNIIQKIPNIHSILLYGSMARGTNDEKSDYDVLVIAHARMKINYDFLGKLPGEANFTLMGIEDWKKKARNDKVFYENVIYDSIVLYGERPVVL